MCIGGACWTTPYLRAENERTVESKLKGGNIASCMARGVLQEARDPACLACIQPGPTLPMFHVIGLCLCCVLCVVHTAHCTRARPLYY